MNTPQILVFQFLYYLMSNDILLHSCSHTLSGSLCSPTREQTFSLPGYPFTFSFLWDFRTKLISYLLKEVWEVLPDPPSGVRCVSGALSLLPLQTYIFELKIKKKEILLNDLLFMCLYISVDFSLHERTTYLICLCIPSN